MAGAISESLEQSPPVRRNKLC